MADSDMALSAPELTEGDFLRIDDPHFDTQTVAVVTGDVAAVVEATAEAGDVRFVANIAGMQHIASIAAFPMEKYDLLLDIMLRAPFKLAQEAIPHIEATDDGVGAIANMSSVHGHYATKDKAAYITAKHGLSGLTRSIAAEGSGTLRGFSVSVGYVLIRTVVAMYRSASTPGSTFAGNNLQRSV